MKRFVIAIFAAMLLVAAMPLLAQEQTASIQGAALDGSGAALPGVTVEAVNTRGQRFNTVTDNSGHYRFPSVPPGMYSVTASLSGMKTATAKDVSVTLGSSPKVDLTLKLAQVSETLTVTAEAPIVDVTSSATATSIRSEAIEQLPRGRDFQSVVTQAASANQENRGGGISIDGASGSENKFIMDGVDTSNPQTGVAGKTLVTDFIDEIQVKSAGYAAEYGGAVGGVVNVVTKTGSNDMQGTAGGYYNSRSWGGSPRPVLQLNLAGNGFEQYTPRKDNFRDFEPAVSLGGPIVKDRLWFFGAYEPWLQSTKRTITFVPAQGGATNTYSSKFRRDNYLLNLSGNASSKLLFKAAYNNSGYTSTNLLPGVTGRDNPDVTRYTPDSKFTNWTGSGYADFVASPSWFLSARGGRFFRNYKDIGISADPWIQFLTGSPGQFPDVPASLNRPPGFSTIPTNSASSFDKYTRDDLSFDASWYPQFLGSHRIKGGVQIENLKNDVLTGYQNYRILTFWGDSTRFGADPGKYGAAEIFLIQTTGNVTSKNTGLFIQDSWTTAKDRLTLNVGVRTEQEKVPSYETVGVSGKYAINFKYKDKLAPRLGFSYDVVGNGRTKVYGSYGKFFDITKMELPRGSFGGDKWLDYQFKIDDPNWMNWKCTNITNDKTATTTPQCTGLTLTKNADFPKGYIDLREPSNLAVGGSIDPNLKPMESREFTVGFQQELTQSMAGGFRYVNKHLVRTIEDVGIGRPGAETYFIANPGSAFVNTQFDAEFGPGFIQIPKAKRDYDGFEFEFTKRFLNRWSAHASYLYSRLKGNYSGLANSDESLSGAGRTSPNVNRAFDSVFNLYDASGSRRSVEGRLATDRPHQFKAQVGYSFPFGTTVGLNEFIGSGTPVSTEMVFRGVPFLPYGRGNLGRTPRVFQTDLNLSHEIKFGNYGLQLGAIVLNLFDAKKPTNTYYRLANSSLTLRDLSKCSGDLSVAVCGASAVTPAFKDQSGAFVAGFDPIRQFERQRALGRATPDFRYQQSNAYQDPREVRVYAKVRF